MINLEYIRTLKSLVADFIRDKQPEDVSYYQEVCDWLDSLPTETASPELEKQNTKEDICYQCKWYVKNIRFGDDCPYWKNMINPIKCEHFEQKNTAI